MIGDSALAEMDGLYHCTSLNALTSIFQSRAFHPFFCLEEASYLKNSVRFAFAVVCFADLRSSELKEHMTNFSSEVYVKMSKDWAIRKNVSPVTYYSEKSTLSSAIYRALIDYAVKRREDSEIFYFEYYRINRNLKLSNSDFFVDKRMPWVYYGYTNCTT